MNFLILLSSLTCVGCTVSTYNKRRRISTDLPSSFYATDCLTESFSALKVSDETVFESRYTSEKFIDAVLNQNFGYIQEFLDQQIEPPNLNRHLLISLIKSSTEESLPTVSVLVSKVVAVDVEIQKDLGMFLNSCIGYNLKVFSYLWRRYSAHTVLEPNTISDLIMHSTTKKTIFFVHIIVSSLLNDDTRFRSIFTLVFVKLLPLDESSKLKKIELLLSIGISSDFLSLKDKLLLLNISAIQDNLFVTASLSEDIKVLTPEMGYFLQTPWDVAFIKKSKKVIKYYFSIIDPQIMLQSALIYGSEEFIQELIVEESFTTITQSILFEFAIKTTTSTETLDKLFDFGFDFYHVHKGETILSHAIKTNNMEILEFLIKTRNFDINTVFESKIPGSNQTFTFVAAFFVNSASILYALESYDADLNFQCTTVDEQGKMISYKTPRLAYYSRMGLIPA